VSFTRWPGDHLSRRAVTCSLQQPTRRLLPYYHALIRPHCGGIMCESSGRGHGSCPSDSFPLCLALLPVGVTWPRRLPNAPVVSYTTFSPLRQPQPSYCNAGSEVAARFISVALSASYLARELPGTVPFGVRTFLAPHGFPRQAAITRPTQALNSPVLILPHTKLSSTDRVRMLVRSATE
jgi:hypothetical protein